MKVFFFFFFFLYLHLYCQIAKYLYIRLSHSNCRKPIVFKALSNPHRRKPCVGRWEHLKKSKSWELVSLPAEDLWSIVRQQKLIFGEILLSLTTWYCVYGLNIESTTDFSHHPAILKDCTMHKQSQEAVVQKQHLRSKPRGLCELL